MKRKILFIGIIFLIIECLIGNFVFAATLTNSSLKASLQKKLTTDLFAEISSITIGDSTIKASSQRYNVDLDVTYSVSNEKAIFNTRIKQSDMVDSGLPQKTRQPLLY